MRKLVLAALVVSALVTSAAKAEDTGPYRSAVKAGIKKCLPAVKKLSEFLLQDQKHGWKCTHVDANPDKSVFTCVIETPFSKPTEFFSMSVTPSAGGACSAQYTRIGIWPKNCEAIAREQFSEFQEKDKLGESYAQLLPKKGFGAMRPFLMNLGDTCQVIRTESIADLSK